jgi:hypothetical protein
MAAYTGAGVTCDMWVWQAHTMRHVDSTLLWPTPTPPPHTSRTTTLTLALCITQRFFSSTIQNLSTQSLLLALGMGAKKTIAASAAINWCVAYKQQTACMDSKGWIVSEVTECA